LLGQDAAEQSEGKKFIKPHHGGEKDPEKIIGLMTGILEWKKKKNWGNRGLNTKKFGDGLPWWRPMSKGKEKSMDSSWKGKEELVGRFNNDRKNRTQRIKLRVLS